MDEETRKKAQAIFERLGLTEEQAVELFYKRTIAGLTASKSHDRAPLCLRFSPCQPGKSGADLTASLSSCGPKGSPAKGSWPPKAD